MPHDDGKPPFHALARKWHALAERRLLYYGELYTSGRWTHYFETRERFARHMLDVIKAAKVWAKLAGIDRPADGAANADDIGGSSNKGELKSAA